MSAQLFSLAMSEISDRYIEEAINYQVTKRRRKVKQLFRMAIAACLAIIMGLGTVLAISAEAREIVFGWVKERFGTYTHYSYHEEETHADDKTEPVPVLYCLTEVPPGFTELANQSDGNVQMLVYGNEEMKMIQILITAGKEHVGNVYVLDDKGGTTVESVEVASITGDLYLANDPSRSNAIVWNKDNLFFYMAGTFPPDELVYYAEKLQPMPTTYELTMLPAGYSLWMTQEEDDIHSFLYAKGEDVLTFTYGTGDLDAPVSGNQITWSEGDTKLSLSGSLESWELKALADSVKQITEIRTWEWPAYLPDVPEGYVLQKEFEVPEQRLLVYFDDQGHLLGLTCLTEYSDGEILSYSENTVLKAGIVNGRPADLYIHPDGSDINFICWTDNDIFFTLQGWFPEEELIALAESVAIQPEEEWVWPAYVFSEPPEGYRLTAGGESPDDRVLYYHQTEDGPAVRLKCDYLPISLSTPEQAYSEAVRRETRTVRGQEAALFISPDGTEDNGLIWIEGDVRFEVKGPLPIETLVELAEGIVVKPREFYIMKSIPAGYEEAGRQASPGEAVIVYQNEEKKQFQFSYAESDGNNTIPVHRDGTAFSTYVDGAPADLYLTQDPEAGGSSITWVKQGIRFTISGFFSRAELVDMAENVEELIAEEGTT